MKISGCVIGLMAFLPARYWFPRIALSRAIRGKFLLIRHEVAELRLQAEEREVDDQLPNVNLGNAWRENATTIKRMRCLWIFIINSFPNVNEMREISLSRNLPLHLSNR